MNFVNVISGPSLTMQQVEESAKSFQKAMKGFGTDEARIIKELVNHNIAQRLQIKKQYLAMYGHTLEDDLKSEIKGNFLEAALALLKPTDEYDAECLRNAIKGLGTKEKVCIQILCSNDAYEIGILKAAFQRLYNKNLVEEMAGEASGDLGRVFQSISNGLRSNDQHVNQEMANKDAQDLYDAGQGKVGTDELEFVRVLCSRSFVQLKATFEAYHKISNTDIEKAIKKETSGDLETALLAIVKSARNRPGYFAEQLHESMKGMGTRESDLLRLLISRSEIDLQAIKYEFKKLYNKSLYDMVKDELSGDFEKLLLGLIGKD